VACVGVSIPVGKPAVPDHMPGMAEFIQWHTGTHTCGCGAKYKVTVTKAPTGHMSCEKCGRLIDSPANRSFLVYERIPRDE
jgi:hypothetical protein